MKRPELGQKVVITGKAQKGRRYWEEDVEGYEEYGHRAVMRCSESKWYEQNINPIDGVFIGYRTWSIGTSLGGEYDISETREVWLVAFDPRQKPVAVFPEHCEIA